MRSTTPAARKRQTIGPVPEVNPDPLFDTGGKPTDVPTEANGISGRQLLVFIERIERVQAEIRSLQADVKEIKSEAKGTGFDTKIIMHLIRVRKQDADDQAEFEALVDSYSRAIGMMP